MESSDRRELSPKSIFSVAGKVALITGGSKGLGKIIAHTLARGGADVAISSRNPDEARMSLEEIVADTQVKGYFFTEDHSDWTGARQFAARVIRETGNLDILINNAGASLVCPLAESDDSQLESVHSLNLFAPTVLCREFLPILRKSPSARIINISSVLGVVGREYRTAYSSTKGGLITLTKSLALELAPFKITVNAIAPGQFLTPLTQPMWEDEWSRSRVTSLIPLKRWGTGENISGAVLLLASEAGKYITGQTLIIDGGWSVC